MKLPFRSACTAFCLTLAVICFIPACTHAPHAITLPTTAAIRAPINVAQAHVARAVEIGHQEAAIATVAVARGIVAGSPESKQLAALITADSAAKQGVQDQLAAALYQAGEMDREQARVQAQYDALARDDAAKTVQVGALRKSRWHWRGALLGLLVADFFAGAPIQLGMHAAVRFVAQVGAALVKHLIAFWPVLLAMF